MRPARGFVAEGDSPGAGLRRSSLSVLELPMQRRSCSRRARLPVERTTAPLRAAGCAFALNDFTGQEAGFEICKAPGYQDRQDRRLHHRSRHARRGGHGAGCMTIQQRCRSLEAAHDLRTESKAPEGAQRAAAAFTSGYVRGLHGMDVPQPPHMSPGVLAHAPGLACFQAGSAALERRGDWLWAPVRR